MKLQAMKLIPVNFLLFFKKERNYFMIFSLSLIGLDFKFIKTFTRIFNRPNEMFVCIFVDFITMSNNMSLDERQ
jgi:hypothetical protein